MNKKTKLVPIVCAALLLAACGDTTGSSSKESEAPLPSTSSSEGYTASSLPQESTTSIGEIESSKDSELTSSSEEASSSSSEEAASSSSEASSESSSSESEEPPAPSKTQVALTPEAGVEKLLELAGKPFRVHELGVEEGLDEVYGPRYITAHAAKKGYILLPSEDPEETSGYDEVVYTYFYRDDGTIALGVPYLRDGGYYVTYLQNLDSFNPMATLKSMADYNYWGASAFAQDGDGLTLNANDMGSQQVGNYMLTLLQVQAARNLKFRLYDDGSLEIDVETVVVDEYGNAVTDDNGEYVTEVSATFAIDEIGTASDPAVEERFPDGKIEHLNDKLMGKLLGKNASFTATLSIVSKSGSEDPTVEGMSRVIIAEGAETYATLDPETGAVSQESQYFDIDGIAQRVSISPANEVVYTPVTSGGDEVAWADARTDLSRYISGDDLVVDPAYPDVYSYVGPDAAALVDLVSLFDTDLLYGMYYGQIQQLNFIAHDGVIDEINAIFADGGDGTMREDYHYEVNIDITDDFDVPTPPTEALAPIEGTTEKAEKALAMLDGTHVVRMDMESKSSSGDYRLSQRTYIDPDTRSTVVETHNGDAISSIKGEKEDGDQGLIPFAINDGTAVATGPSTEGTYDDLITIDIAPEALMEDADGNLVLRPEIDTTYLSSYLPFSSIYSAEDLIFKLDADGNLGTVEYGYDGGAYFGWTYYRYSFAYDEAAAFPADYADTINLLTAFVAPTTWQAYWAIQTAGANYYQTMVDYFLYDDAKYPDKTPSGLTSDEAAARLEEYVPFLYDEHMRSPYASANGQATDNTYTTYYYVLSVSFSLFTSETDPVAYRDSYLALLAERGYRHLDRTEDADELIYSSRNQAANSTYEQYKSEDGEVILEVQTNGGSSFYIYVYDLTKPAFTY